MIGWLSWLSWFHSSSNWWTRCLQTIIEIYRLLTITTIRQTNIKKIRAWDASMWNLSCSCLCYSKQQKQTTNGSTQSNAIKFFEQKARQQIWHTHMIIHFIWLLLWCLVAFMGFHWAIRFIGCTFQIMFCIGIASNSISTECAIFIWAFVQLIYCTIKSWIFIQIECNLKYMWGDTMTLAKGKWTSIFSYRVKVK